MNNRFELVDNIPQNAVIKVIGVGGGGGNAVKHMIARQVEGVEFVCANTDAQSLKNISAKTVLQLGGGMTRGLGAGANPDVGRQAAMEDKDRIAEILRGADMVFIAAGMGGGTGTGAAPVIAQIARDMGVLTVAVVTKPFSFEGPKRMRVALKGIEELSQHVDSLITIPNQKLAPVLGANTSLLAAFEAANNVLLDAVQGIADLIIRPGMINADFADVRTVMSEMGLAMMGTGRASGENRARLAAEMALGSPLLDDVNLQGARGILVNITGGMDLGLGEFEEVGQTIDRFASDNATVVIGTVIDPDMTDEIRITLVATGLGIDSFEQSVPVQTQPAVPTPRRQPLPQRPLQQYERSMVTPRTPAAQPVVQPAMVAAAPLQGAAVAKTEAEDDLDYLDIPAFLRRQAD